MNDFNYSPIFPISVDETEYIKISDSYVRISKINNKEILFVDPKALTFLAQRAFKDVSHLLRKSHLKQLRNILDDKESSGNDKFVALTMLKNANISASGVLPTPSETSFILTRVLTITRSISSKLYYALFTKLLS